MENIIGILIIILLYMVMKIRKIEKASLEVKGKLQDTIEGQEKQLREVTQEKEYVRKKAISYAQETDRMKKQLWEVTQEKEYVQKKVNVYAQEIDNIKKEMEELERKLDFYKNIKEESGNLNVFDDNEEREKLIEKTVQQINFANRREEKQIGSPDGTLEKVTAVLDSEQNYVRDEMEHSNCNFFVTGKAGTGKSFLLDVFRRTTNKKHIVLAPTGLAALNIKGVTLHSAFGYDNLVNLDVDAITIETIRLKSEKRLILKEVSTIIIDEISMVRADTFDKIDKILRVINHNDLPFGGKQVLLFGDLFQLPPVIKNVECEYLYDRYGGEHFFCSDAYKKNKFNFFELTINHRQKDDSEFFSLLNRVRDGSLIAKDIEMLNSRVVKDISIYDRYTTLLPTKAEAEKLNQYHIDQLDSEEYVYYAEIEYDKYPNHTHRLESVFPISSTLRLKKGALVMMVTNDSEHRWVNGTLGIIKGLSDDGITVAINKRVYNVHLEEFSEKEIIYKNGKLTYEDVLVVKQYPIVLAYAITIHKSQGQTYQNIVCDIDRCFANGQAYVALSRCASLEGLHLKQRITSASIQADKRVIEFYAEQLAKR